MCTFLFPIGVALNNRFSYFYPFVYYLFVKFTQVIFISDAFISLNTSKSYEGKMLTDRHEIAKIYCKE